MKLTSLFAVLGIMSLLSLCSGYIGGGPLMIQELSPQIYCGRNLAMAIAELCSFRKSGKSEKRGDSGSGTIYDALFLPYYKEPETRMEQYPMGWPWIPHHKARALALPSRGKRFTGIVDECCTKGCSIDEMWAYCT